jgi:hypothetical protein
MDQFWSWRADMGYRSAIFLKVAHCRAAEMHGFCQASVIQRIARRCVVKRAHYLSRRTHQTTGGKHGKFRLPACFP